MKIDVVIPNYNGADLLIKNLPSVVESLKEYQNFKITIVDDGSEDPDYQKALTFVTSLKENRVPIELIRKNKNTGFSSTVNKGALASNADFLVLLNSDVSPTINFLTPIFKDFENNKKLFAVGCMDKSEEEKGIILRGRGIASWRRGLLVHQKGDVKKSDTFWVSGGSSVMRSEFFKLLKGFDEIYDPFYWEDIDLSYRARKSGYEIMFENKSVVVHRHNEGAIKKHFSSLKIKRIAYRNQFIFVWKNITDNRFLLFHILWFPYHILMSLKRFDFAFVIGFILAASKLPVIIKKRSNQKRFYTKSDNEIINNNSGI